MLLKTLVKVSVNNLSDARYCASMGVQLIGLPIDPQQEPYINPAQFQELTQWVHGVQLVGEVGQTGFSTIQEVVQHYPVDYLQLNHPVDLSILAKLSTPVCIKINLTETEDLANLASCLAAYGADTRYFILETDAIDPSTISQIQIQVNKLAQGFPILQGFNLTPSNITELLKTKIQGFALQGGTEIKPGYKDFDELANLIVPLLKESPF